MGKILLAQKFMGAYLAVSCRIRDRQYCYFSRSARFNSLSLAQKSTSAIVAGAAADAAAVVAVPDSAVRASPGEAVLRREPGALCTCASRLCVCVARRRVGLKRARARALASPTARTNKTAYRLSRC